MHKYLINFNFLLLLGAVSFAHGADDAREKKWADEIVPQLVVGEAQILKTASGREFLSLFTEVKDANVAVVLVHGLGVHPDYGIIGSLRSRLADLGYTTLSLQMPVLAAGAKAEDYFPATFPEAGERINAAGNFLREKNYKRIALISHSLGARMSNVYLTENSPTAYSAWISMGITVPFTGMARITLPVLDLYGEKDFDAVLRDAPARAEAIKKNNGSEQKSIKGAEHYFTSKEADVAQAIQQFLDKRYGK
jgi:dienelactone hydrolase